MRGILLTQRHNVHALVRNPHSEKGQALKDLGAVIFEGGFDNADMIRVATASAHGLFLNPFLNLKDPDVQLRQGMNVIHAAVDEQCHLVMSSPFPAAEKHAWDRCGSKDFLYLYYSQKFAVEKQVGAAGLKTYAIIRPPYLMQNNLIVISNFHYLELPTKGVMERMYEPGRKMAHLDVADVGKIATVILLNPEKYDKLEIDVAVESLDAVDAAKAIRKVAGRQYVRAEKIEINKFDTETMTGLT